jgi:hypothetical protein
MPSDLIRGWVPVFPRDKREAFARRSCSNKKIERDDDSKKSHSALGLEFELWFVGRSYSRLCFACRRIFHVTNRLGAIRPIRKAVPHDLVEARRVSWRQRGVPGRSSAGARKRECHFLATQIRRVICRSFCRQIEERGFRRGCNGHLHGLQQTVVFEFAHRALVRELWSFRPFCTHRDSPTLPTPHFGLRMSLFNRSEAARNRVFLVKVTARPNVGSRLMAHRRSRPPHGRIVCPQDAGR